MFSNQSPIFIRLDRYGRTVSQISSVRGWWFVLGPGLVLVGLGLAFLIWPVFFASLTALLLLLAGGVISFWALRLRLVENRLRQRMQVVSGEVLSEDVRYYR